MPVIGTPVKSPTTGMVSQTRVLSEPLPIPPSPAPLTAQNKLIIPVSSSISAMISLLIQSWRWKSFFFSPLGLRLMEVEAQAGSSLPPVDITTFACVGEREETHKLHIPTPASEVDVSFLSQHELPFPLRCVGPAIDT